MRQSAFSPIIIGTDISSSAAGLSMVDHPYVLPHSGERNLYLDSLEKLCTKYAPTLVIPGSDGEARVLVGEKPRYLDMGISIVAQSANVWKVTGDKLMLFKYCVQAGIAAPYTLPASPDNMESILRNYGQAVLKPREGSGSRSTFIVSRESNFPLSADNSFVVQEYVGPDSDEYTVGAYFVHHGGASRLQVLIAMKRRLERGNTISADIVQSAPFESVVTKLGELLAMEGYCNFQFIDKSGERLLIDVNARMSSSISIARAVGINYLDIALAERLKGRLPPFFRSIPGVSVVRYLEDFVYLTSSKPPEYNDHVF